MSVSSALPTAIPPVAGQLPLFEAPRSVLDELSRAVIHGDELTIDARLAIANVLRSVGIVAELDAEFTAAHPGDTKSRAFHCVGLMNHLNRTVADLS